MPSVLAVVLVVAVIVLVGVLRDGGSTGGGSPAVVASTPRSQTSAPVPTSPAPSTASITTSAPAPTTSAPPPAPATLAPADTTVGVFNVTRRHGLAAAESDRLKAAGYQVNQVANRPGYPLSTTTAFYDPGNAVAQAAAEALVAKGVGVQAAAPRPANVEYSAILVVYVTS